MVPANGGTSTAQRAGLIGGLLGLIPFLSTSPGPKSDARLVYFGSLGTTALVLVVCTAAALTTHTERADSVKAIKADFDTHILGTFEPPASIETVVSAHIRLAR